MQIWSQKFIMDRDFSFTMWLISAMHTISVDGYNKVAWLMFLFAFKIALIDYCRNISFITL